MSYNTVGREWLWRNPDLLNDEFQPLMTLESLPEPTSFDTWANWGGDKTWPAPQGWTGPHEWAGPPDAVLDGGPYKVTHVERLLVELQSATDPITGLSISRRIRLHDSTNELTVQSTLTNNGFSTRNWAVWEVTQLATESATDDPKAQVIVRESNTAPPVVPLIMHEPMEYSIKQGRTVVPIQDIVGKLGFPGCSGEISFETSRDRFTQTFNVVPAGIYPDQGSRAEVWMQHPTVAPLPQLPDLHPNGHLVELECLSPLRRLTPGSATELTVKWTATARNDL